uniref:NADP-dependent oxidoreductase domain-containing protein n=1 Tax=Ditylenchus dipsaci TaxID=166011 RepID=A0A915ELQ3_9BILA
MTSSFSNILGGSFCLLDGNYIPFIGLGTYGLRSQQEIDSAVDAALERGYRLFDTANYYANEQQLGDAFQVNFGQKF